MRFTPSAAASLIDGKWVDARSDKTFSVEDLAHR